MEAASFDESNFTFDKPADMSHEECQSLSVWRGQEVGGQDIIISCWKPTAEELEEINRTGRIWCFHYGDYLQPHALVGKNPFKE